MIKINLKAIWVSTVRAFLCERVISEGIDPNSCFLFRFSGIHFDQKSIIFRTKSKFVELSINWNSYAIRHLLLKFQLKVPYRISRFFPVNCFLLLNFSLEWLFNKKKIHLKQFLGIVNSGNPHKCKLHHLTYPMVSTWPRCLKPAQTKLDLEKRYDHIFKKLEH